MTKNHNIYKHFKRPFVRDLAFAISCPNAINYLMSHNNCHPICIHQNDFWQEQIALYYNKLKQLDTTKEYQKLTKFLMKRPSPHRLGFHFEGLILFWLIDGFTAGLHPFEMINHNIQIIENNITLGELDVIIKNHQTNEVEHWELTIKFFVGYSPYKTNNWSGVNSPDNLDRKINHMINKPFTHTTAIDINGINHVIDKRYAIIKGRFFKPHQELFPEDNLQLPSWINQDFPMHFWYNSKKIFLRHHSSDCNIRKAKYIEWFTPRDFINQYNNVSKLNFKQPQNGLYFLKNNNYYDSDNETPFVFCN